MIDIINKEGLNLMHLAVFHNNTQIVELLLNKVKNDYKHQDVAKWVNA